MIRHFSMPSREKWRDGRIKPLPWNAGRSIWSTILAVSTPLILTGSSPPPCSTLCRPIGPSDSPLAGQAPGLFCSPSASMAGWIGRRETRPTRICAAGSKPIRRRTRALVPPWVPTPRHCLPNCWRLSGTMCPPKRAIGSSERDDAAMHRALIEGYRTAALEIAPANCADAIDGWAQRRLDIRSEVF